MDSHGQRAEHDGSHAAVAEDHHEKKSVMGMVRARARKIKDSIKAYGHDQDQDHIADHGPDDHGLDEEDDEKFEDPQAHGSASEATATKFPSIPGQVQSSHQPVGMDSERSTKPMVGDATAPSGERTKVGFGKSAVHALQGGEVPQAPQNTPTSVTPGTYKDSDPAKTSFHEQEHPGQPKFDLERPTELEEEPHGQNVGSDSYNPSNYETKVNDPTKTGGERFEDPQIHGAASEATATRFTSIPGQVQSSDQPVGMDSERSTKPMIEDAPAPSSERTKDSFGKSTFQALQGGEVPQATQNTPTTVTPGTYKDSDPAKTSLHEQEHPGQPKFDLERPKELEEEETYGQNVGSDSYNPSNYETKVNDPTKTRGEEAGITPIVHSFDKMNISEGGEQKYGTEQKQSTAKTSLHGQEHPGQQKFDLERPKELEEETYGQNVGSDSYKPSNYETKVNDPTKTRGEEGGITPIVHSFDKMNISEGAEQKHGTEQKQSKPIETENQFENFPTGSHDEFTPETGPPRPLKTEDESLLVPQGTDSTASQDNPHDATAEKPSSQSSYAKKITPVTPSIADKAISAKNVVASKLGYGEKDETRAEDTHDGEETKKPVSAVEYGKKVEATGTEKLNPVNEKVAPETGDTEMSKLEVSQRTNTGNENESKNEVKEHGKGGSMKDNFAEKLRPGEEDKALSKVISDSFGKKKEEFSNVISASFGKKKEETKPMGKVAESEEVAGQLGTPDDKSEEKVDSSSVNSPGKGMVGKVTGAVSSWFSKADESQPTQPSHSE